MTVTLDSTQVPTLVIGDWASRCSACGGNASPAETAHHRSGTVLTPWLGCGVAYAAVGLDVEASCSEAGPAAVARSLGLGFIGRVPWPTRSAS